MDLGRPREGEWRQVDEAEIRIGDVVVSMTRRNNLNVPAEFSAFIPRAEIRRRFQDGRLTDEEIVLSSITIVHSPRHRTGSGATPARDERETRGGARAAAPAGPRVTFRGNPE